MAAAIAWVPIAVASRGAIVGVKEFNIISDPSNFAVYSGDRWVKAVRDATCLNVPCRL